MLKKKNSLVISNNDILKSKRNKKILLIGVSIFLVVVIVVLITTGSLSNLMGNSVTEYYCEDSSYKLEGNKCVKEIKERSAFLGDINLDDKVTNEDLDLLTRYINYIDYDEADEEVSNLKPIQIKAADVSEDNEVYNLDIDILREYLESSTSTYGIHQENIGVKRICNDEFTLEGTECVKREIQSAKIKNTEVIDEKKEIESTNTNTNEKKNNSTNEFTIEFDGNGGEGNMSNMILSSANNIKLGKNEFKNGNKVFVGWNVYSKKQFKWLYYKDTDNRNIDHDYVFSKNDMGDKVQFEEGEIIKKLPVVDDDILIFYAQWFEDNDSIRFSTNYKYNSILEKGKVIKFSGDIFSPSKDKIQMYYKFKNYEYNNLVNESDCKRVVNRAISENVTVNEYTSGAFQLYLDSKCTKKYKEEYKTGILHCKYCAPVEVSFDDKKDTYYKKDSKVNVGINFNVKDISQSYYFEVGNYLYGDIDNRHKSGCKKIEGSKINYGINIDGNRDLKVKIFYDDECSRPILTDKIFKSPKYKCDNCTNAVQTLFNIYFDGERNNTFEKNSKFNMDVDFSLEDKEEEYYYIISNFLNGKLDNSTKCTKVTDGQVKNSFVLNGQRETKVTIYNDSLCKNKYKEESSGKILYKDFDKYSATIEPVKAITTNIQNGNKTTDNKIASKSVISNNTNLYLKLNFDINDNSKDYYYHIDTDAYYNFYGIIYKGVNIDYSSKSSNCFKVPKSGNETKIMNIVIPNSGDNLPSTSFSNIDDIKKNSNIIKYQVKLYDNEKCSGISLKNSNESKSSVSYRLQTFNVSYDANGGVAKVSKTAIPQINGNSLTYKYSNVLTLFYNYKNKRIIPSGSSEVYKNGGHDLMGYKVKNSKGEYMCYTNVQKNSQGYTDENTCKKNGYVIYTDDNILSRTSAVDGETISFVAQWITNYFTIKYNANGGSGSMENQQVQYGVATELSRNTFKRANYSFAGWVAQRDDGTCFCYTSPAKNKVDWLKQSNCKFGYYVYKDKQSVSTTTSPYKKVTMYAQWKPIQFTVKFKANGGTGSMNDQKITYGVSTALYGNVFKRTGYLFNGWVAQRWDGLRYCYTSPSKTSAAWLNANTCKNNGYYYFKNSQVLSNTVPAGRVVTMFAQWKKK